MKESTGIVYSYYVNGLRRGSLTFACTECGREHILNLPVRLIRATLWDVYTIYKCIKCKNDFVVSIRLYAYKQCCEGNPSGTCGINWVS